MKFRKRKPLSRRNRKLYDDIIQSYLESIGSPKALAVWLCFKYKEHDQLLELEADPRRYLDRLSFHKDYLAVKFLSKFNGLSTSFDKTATAIEAFKGFEVRCRETNARIQHFPHHCDSDVAEIVRLVRGKIRNVLGECNSTVLEKVFGMAGFGPGVSTTIKGRWLSPWKKLGDPRPGVTKTLDYVLSLSLTASDYPSWPGIHLRQSTPGNTITCVPKNSKTDRTIAIEPQINSFFQKGVGAYLRGKLKRHFGIDLTSQEANQEFARQGSISGEVATLDLEAASDTVSNGVVELLIPQSWSTFLRALRSPMYFLDGKWYPYEKHSSMGNGYTFELETLIFASIASCCCDAIGIAWEGTCYGDDMIAPTRAVPLIQSVLTYLGFTLNTKKSYWESPFRESCGADWYAGVKVTPFYLRKQGDNLQVQTFANWLRTESPSWMNISKTWWHCYHYLPRPFRYKIPNGLDGGLIVNEWEWDPSYVMTRRPYGPVVGVTVKLLHFQGTTRRPKESESQPGPVSFVAACLYSLDKMASNDLFSLYERREACREGGRWRVRSTVFSEPWPIVRPV